MVSSSHSDSAVAPVKLADAYASPPPKPVPVSPSSSIGSVLTEKSCYTSLSSILRPEAAVAVSSREDSSSLFDLEGITRQLHHFEAATNNSVKSGKNLVSKLQQNRPMKVLFLSSDTGGGHRASAESLANQIMIQFPGSEYDLLDVWIDDGIWPYKKLVDSYKYFSANPSYWRMFYHLTNSAPVNYAFTWHSTLSCESKIRKRIESYNPDVLVSVHPTMQHAPLRACRNIAMSKGKHIPFFTVVTDLASAHAQWFEKGVDKIYLASDSLNDLARHRAGIPEGNIFRTGLPIRHDFAVQAKKLGDRNSPEGQAYQKQTKSRLGIDPNKQMVLIMGGGEGVGGLSSIVNEVYTALTMDGVDATLCVVCGRNDQLRTDLQERDWDAVLWGECGEDSSSDIFCSNTTGKPIHPKLLQQEHQGQNVSMVQEEEEKKEDDGQDAAAENRNGRGNVSVMGLGFITQMAQYMVAASVLVTKAGPGTISEATSVGLPILLTSFLPGQEAGNVDFVLDGGFGAFCQDPVQIGSTASSWLRDVELLHKMSSKAKEAGRPNAAAEIIADIGATTQTWLEINERRKRLRYRSSSSVSVDGISEFIVE